MNKKHKNIKYLAIGVGILVLATFFYIQVSNLIISYKVDKNQPVSIENSKDWTRGTYLSHASWTATSSDNTQSISCRALPNQSSNFFVNTELVVKEISGLEKRYRNSEGICPFRWVGNVVYGVGPAYESSADILKMDLVNGYIPGKVTHLNFESHGILDVSQRYYAFTNIRDGEDKNKGILFCVTGDIEPSWQRIDQLGVLDLETGNVTILRSQQGKIFKIEGWSRNSQKILYREYDAPKLEPGQTEQYYCPERSAGKMYSIDILTKEIHREIELDNTY